MKKWVKRIVLLLAFLLLAGAVFVGTVYNKSRSVPKWYVKLESTPEEIRAAANRVDQSLLAAYSWISEVRADETRAGIAQQQGTTLPIPQAEGSRKITFTEQELNAFFTKWSDAFNWKRVWGPYVEEPRLVIQDGRLIFAGRVEEMNGSIVSLHFAPQIDKDGMLLLNLDQIMSGTLPLPRALADKPLNKLQDVVRRSLPANQQRAKIKSDGAANNAALAASLSKLLLNALSEKPSDAVIFLRMQSDGEYMPVRITDVSIGEQSISLTLQPMNAEERKVVLDHIREPYNKDAVADGRP